MHQILQWLESRIEDKKSPLLQLTQDHLKKALNRSNTALVKQRLAETKRQNGGKITQATFTKGLKNSK